MIPTSDSKLSLDPPLVDQVVDSDLSVVDPTLPLESEVKVVESVSSTSDHHVDDTPSTSDPLVRVRKGKVLYPCLICKDIHRTFICPSMDEASRCLENITDHQ